AAIRFAIAPCAWYPLACGRRINPRSNLPRPALFVAATVADSRRARKSGLLADELAAAQLEPFGVAAQRVGFGKDADDAEALQRLRHCKRFGFGLLKGGDGLVHAHGRQKHGVTVMENVADGKRLVELMGVSFGDEDDAGVILLLVDRHDVSDRAERINHA